MPAYTIEVSYRLPVHRHRTYCADTPEAGCSLAIDDKDWTAGRSVGDTAGETYVSGIWEGADADIARPSIPVPSQFGERVQRKAAHFETLLGLLKMFVADILSGHSTSSAWLARALWAVARAEAIIAGTPDPDTSAHLPRPSHALAWLHEDRVRDQIVAILETDSGFAGVTSEMVSDQNIRAACRAVVEASGLAEDIGVAEFRAALAALGEALRRLRER